MIKQTNLVKKKHCFWCVKTFYFFFFLVKVNILACDFHFWLKSCSFLPMRYISSNNVRHPCVMVPSARACVTANQADDPLDLLESIHRHVASKYGSLLSLAVSNCASENSRGKRCASLHCNFPTSSCNGGESWRPPPFLGSWDPSWLMSVSLGWECGLILLFYRTWSSDHH